MKTKKPKRFFYILLEAEERWDLAPPIIRLRHFLKSALRAWHLRCVDLREVPKKEEEAK